MTKAQVVQTDMNLKVEVNLKVQIKMVSCDVSLGYTSGQKRPTEKLHKCFTGNISGPRMADILEDDDVGEMALIEIYTTGEEHQSDKTNKTWQTSEQRYKTNESGHQVRWASK